MNLGNVSQTIIPVPNFFLNRNNNHHPTIEIFHTHKSIDKRINKFPKNHIRTRSYFRDKDLITSLSDLNLNNNPRYIPRHTDFNEQKYIPLYNRDNYPRNSKMKDTYFPEIINTFLTKTKSNLNEKKGCNGVRDYLEKNNLNKFLKPDLREEIMHNTKNLIERINANYDIKTWNDFDCRTTMDKIHQTAYSPLVDVINNTENIQDDFNKTLKKEILSLRTINDKTKMILKKNLPECEDISQKKQRISLSIPKGDILLETNRNNLMKLRQSYKSPIVYSERDQKFIDENKYITDRINKNGFLYRGFPSKTRMEFNEKRMLPKFHKYKANDGNFFNKNEYKCLKEDFSLQDPIWKRPLHSDAYIIDN